MAARGRHHALARPEDVEAWCASLHESRTAETVYGNYWIKIANMYDWLRWHTEHPHVYDPVLMAAAEYRDGAAGVIWDEKIRKGTTNS